MAAYNSKTMASKSNDTEKLIKRISHGEWAICFVNDIWYGSVPDEKYRFITPVMKDDLGAAMSSATKSFAALPEEVRDMLSIKVVYNSDTQAAYGAGVGAVVVEEDGSHVYPETGLKNAIKELGNSVFDSYAPAEIKKAFDLVKLKRGSDESVEEQ